MIEEGAEPGPCYVVREGRLRVHSGAGDLDTLRRGILFGEGSVYGRRPRTAAVSAVSEAGAAGAPCDRLS